MRAVVAAVAAFVLAVVLSGCAATFTTDIQMDRHGRGDVTLSLQLDPGGLQALGLSASDPDAVATRFLPLISDGGWQPPEGARDVVQNVFAFSADAEGGVTLRTLKAFDNVAGLKAIVVAPRDLRAVAGVSADSVFAGLRDLPGTAPLINNFTFRLGDGTGDNPGFYFHGRGGVGDFGKQTCAGDRVEAFSKALRDALTLEYRLRVPGGPGSTHATRISGSQAIWTSRYGDCASLQAESGGGSASTLFNGLVLGGLASFLIIIFIARGVRRRRGTRPVHVSPPAADDDAESD